MDWNVLASLTTSLAWPIVALIALPFVIMRLDSLISAIRDARKLSEQLPEFIETGKVFRELRDQIQQMKGEILDTFDAAEARREIEQAPLEELTEELASEPTPVAAAPAPNVQLTPAQRFAAMSEAWASVKDALSSAFERLHIGQPDLRSVATAARKLSDGRRRTPLSVDVVNSVVRLQSIYNAFRRMNQKDPLTTETLANFRSEASRVKEVLDQLS